MTNEVATELLRQLKQQKLNLQNSLSDAQARIAVLDADIAGLQRLKVRRATPPFPRRPAPAAHHSCPNPTLALVE